MSENSNKSKTTKTATTDNISTKEVIDSLVKKALKAQAALEKLNQEQIDKITHTAALAGLAEHMRLAKMACDETGRGVYEDKCIKNIFSTEYIWNSIRNLKTVGVIENNETEGYMTVAEPIGIIAGVTPVTNPTSTTLFKALIALKTRNPIIFGFHPSAQKCSSEAARIIRDAAISCGAPEGCVQWIEAPSVEATKELMNHENVNMILATGGSGMVKSAYSCGKPALGVGPGNVPCYIEKTSNLTRAVKDVIVSKTFDNGMICASEQAVIVDKEIYDEVKKEFQLYDCYFPTAAEIKKLEPIVIDEKTHAVNPNIVGKPAFEIAKMAGITIPENTKMIIAEIDGVGEKYPLSREKLSPVLAMIKAKSTEDGLNLSLKMLEFGGLGHTAVIHTNDKDVELSWGLLMKAGRLIVNSPSTQGAIGDIYNAVLPSLTLGCGSYGRNSTASNVGAVNLLNFKRIAIRKNNMQWFKVPPKIFFEKNSTQYLKHLRDIKRVFVVTDQMMVNLGYVNYMLSYLNQNPAKPEVHVFSDVEADPSDTTVYRGVEAMKFFKPDCIIALGGGSPMDAAKAMWVLYENEELCLSGVKQKFLDIRKRTYRFPSMKDASKFIAIPTTSGTGSEVTPFTVITDSEQHCKYPLADYAFTPDVAIIDYFYTMSVPASVTADTGMDVLTHAMEAYVSVLANDFTDGLALKAMELVFKWLPVAYSDPSNETAREKMHNASSIAGMAFANSFLGINHSLAHKIGAEFGIPHGRANAILMPHVIRYNATRPTKHAAWPKYESYIADKRYAEIAKYLGMTGKTTEELVEKLIKAVYDLGHQLKINMSISEQGISKETFEAQVAKLADKAFEDQCTPANPRMPLVTELMTILRDAYKSNKK